MSNQKFPSVGGAYVVDPKSGALIPDMSDASTAAKHGEIAEPHEPQPPAPSADDLE